jgi:hypothetical protein
MKPDDIISYNQLVAEEKANLQDTALGGSAFPLSGDTPQDPTAARNKMAALLSQLFYSTQIPVCLWFLEKNKNADAKRGFRDRRHQILVNRPNPQN